MEKVVVIGAGPGGSNCAIWLKQLGYDVLLIDKEEGAGGLQRKNPYTNSWIVTSPGATGNSISNSINESLKRHKVRTMFRHKVESIVKSEHGVCISVKDRNGESVAIESEYVVLATGTVPQGLSMLDTLNRARLIVGASPKIEDTSEVKGKSVAVLGGGDSAFETAKKLNETGASEVYVFARNIRARPMLIEAAGPLHIIEGEEYTIKESKVIWNGLEKNFDQIVVMYGFTAALEFAKGLELALDQKGYIRTDAECRTSIDKIFAIGEIANRSHPCCTTAMADGVIAAKAVQRDIESQGGARFAAIKRAGRLLLTTKAGHG